MTTAETPTNQFGFKFISDEEVPDPPQARDKDKERWEAVKIVLEENPGKWLMAKEYPSAQGAQTKASQVNNNTTKIFPAAEGWEARTKVLRKKNPKTDDDGASELYLRYSPVAEEATAE